MAKGDLLDRWSQPPTGPESRPRYLLRKVLRHAYWARTEGFHRLVEEDRLDPRERIRTAVAKARWRRANPLKPGTARPVFVVGLQRSGTNMLMRGFDEDPSVEVHNENDGALFERFQLRSDDSLTRVVRHSRHRLVLIKPICDSQRTDHLLDLVGANARALWVYRNAEDRARSEVSKFGQAPLIAVRAVAEGDESRWQGRRHSSSSIALAGSFDLTTMSPHSASALFWVLRNQQFFDLGLDARDDVILVSYDDFAAHPDDEMRRVCAFLGFPYSPALCAHVEARESHGREPLGIDPRVAELVSAMTIRLEQARRHQDQR